MFRAVKRVFEVYVFQHPRFCDEFSHLMNRSLLASASLYLGLNCMQLMFHTFFKVLVDLYTFCIALKENFELLNECLK